MSLTSHVIGEGTYGCVHKPSLKCKRAKRNYTHKISKIMTKRHAIEEMREFKNIARIDKEGKYYLGVPTECVPNDDKNTLSAIEKCDGAKRFLHAKNARLLIMEYGGLNLIQFADEMAGRVETHENRLKMVAFWKECRRLLYGLKTLKNHKMVHHDLKGENIVYDEEQRRIHFIDFGFMTRFSKILRESLKSENWLSQIHWSFPPEIHFYNKNIYMKYAAMSEDKKRHFVDEIVQQMREKRKNDFTDAYRALFSYVLSEGLSKHAYEIAALAFFKEWETALLEMKPTVSGYKDFVDRSLKTVDIYGTGIAFLYVLNHTSNFISKEMARDLGALFLEMVSGNVFRRIGIDELIEKYESILKRNGLLEGEPATYGGMPSLRESMLKLSPKELDQIRKQFPEKPTRRRRPKDTRI